MRDETLLALSAMAAVSSLVALALALGYDGALLASSLALVSGLAGYKVGKRL